MKIYYAKTYSFDFNSCHVSYFRSRAELNDFFDEIEFYNNSKIIDSGTINLLPGESVHYYFD